MFRPKDQAQKHYQNGLAYVQLALNYKMVEGFTHQDLSKEIAHVYKSAAQMFGTALCYDSNHLQSYIFRASVYQRQQYYSLAIQDYLCVLLIDENNEDAINGILSCLNHDTVNGKARMKQAADAITMQHGGRLDNIIDLIDGRLQASSPSVKQPTI